MRYVARKPLRLHGTDYGPGETVDLGGATADLTKKLLDQRRIIAVSAADTRHQAPAKKKASGAKRKKKAARSNN